VLNVARTFGAVEIRSSKFHFTERSLNRMQQNEDPRKRPLLTAEQLRNMRRGAQKIHKGTPREEFEKLFRRPLRQRDQISRVQKAICDSDRQRGVSATSA
jgi:hypothetical protein